MFNDASLEVSAEWIKERTGIDVTKKEVIEPVNNFDKETKDVLRRDMKIFKEEVIMSFPEQDVHAAFATRGKKAIKSKKILLKHTFIVPNHLY